MSSADFFVEITDLVDLHTEVSEDIANAMRKALTPWIPGFDSADATLVTAPSSHTNVYSFAVISGNSLFFGDFEAVDRSLTEFVMNKIKCFKAKAVIAHGFMFKHGSPCCLRVMTDADHKIEFKLNDAFAGKADRARALFEKLSRCAFFA